MALIDRLRSLAADGVFARQKNEDLRLLEEAIDRLRTSTMYSLQRKYTTALGVEIAAPLAAAVVNEMILDPPTDVRSKIFNEKNSSMISKESSEAHKHEGISGPSGCASYLYAAKILHCTIFDEATAATEVSKLAQLLRRQAADLRIFVPSCSDICGSDNRSECIQAINSFAKVFYYTNTWSGSNAGPAEMPLPSIPYQTDSTADIQPAATVKNSGSR